MQTKTVLVIAGYQPVAKWLHDCLALPSRLIVAVSDASAARRVMMLVQVNAVVAWPILSEATTDQVLELTRHVPVLLISWDQPYDARAAWMRPPLTAEDLRRRLLAMLYGESNSANWEYRASA